MMRSLYLLVGGLVFLSSFSVCAQSTQQNQKTQMQYISTFEAGQPGAGIYKLYDASDDVICYVLMPDTATRKQIDGKWVYESNSLGSISCLKARTTIPQKSAK
ncbi:MAG: hypothetical protein ACOYBT_00305 [Polynucleobacter sp.]